MGTETIKETKAKTGKCAHNFICQTEDGVPHCKITDTVNGTVFFTESRHPDGCPRQYAFGRAFICTCPVRQDLYMKKKI